MRDGYGAGKCCRRPIGCEQRLADGSEQKCRQVRQEDQRAEMIEQTEGREWAEGQSG